MAKRRKKKKQLSPQQMAALDILCIGAALVQ